jgi:hypothetical protein
MKLGYHDFAGSGVHIIGGFGALAMALALGPRKNRFDPAYAKEFTCNNIPYVAGATLLVSFLIFLNESFSFVLCFSIQETHLPSRETASTHCRSRV